MFNPTTKTDGMPSDIWLLPLQLFHYQQEIDDDEDEDDEKTNVDVWRGTEMRMMMFVSHTHPIELNAFVNKDERRATNARRKTKRIGEREWVSEGNCTMIRERKKIDRRHRLMFSIVVYSHGHMSDVITCLSPQQLIFTIQYSVYIITTW